jgi:hypothetical protein
MLRNLACEIRRDDEDEEDVLLDAAIMALASSSEIGSLTCSNNRWTSAAVTHPLPS